MHDKAVRGDPCGLEGTPREYRSDQGMPGASLGVPGGDDLKLGIVEADQQETALWQPHTFEADLQYTCTYGGV